MSTGPRGIQGSTGSSNPLSSKWILTTASSAVDDNPDTGKVKLYASGGGAVVSFSSTTGEGRDMTAFGVALSKLTDYYDTTLTLVRVDDPTTHITIDITSITGPYSSGGTTAFSVTGTTHSSSGTMSQGAQFTITAGNRGEQGVQGSQGAQGRRGHPGATGPQGVQGLQGRQGNQGTGPSVFVPEYGSVYVGWDVNLGHTGHPAPPAPPGVQGHQGPQGLPGGHQGHQGVVGGAGPTGNTGDSPQGPQGHQGHPGVQGTLGDPGNTGPSQGYQGHPGESPVGHPGSRGYQGDTGPTGYDGHPGTTGVIGETGSQGFRGSIGVQGAQGLQGHQGEFGFVGDTGPQGHRGNQGAEGQGFIISKVYNSEAARLAATGGNLPADGEFGLVAGMLDASFDDYGKLYLYKTATGWAYQADMSIRGLVGSQGAQGDRGVQGPQGNLASNVLGVQGNSGYQGDPGNLGVQGYVGGASTPGPQGYQGERGVQGSSSLSEAPGGTGLLYTKESILDPTLASLGLGMEISGSSGSRVLVVGPQRPALDANHIHVYNCDDAPGSTTLVDSGTGAKNLTILGTANTNYTLQETRYGSVPWFRSMLDASSTTGARTSATCSITGGKVTLECVALRPQSNGGFVGYGVVSLDASPDGDLTNGIYIAALDQNLWYTGLRIGGGGYQELSRTASIVNGVPYHLMSVYDPDASPNFKFYVNGILINSGNASGTLPTMTRVTVSNLAARGADSCRLYIRDVRVSNIARSASYAMEMANALTHL